MIIWAVGTTRNEADIIRANVLHHHSQGVSHFVWLDNGSTDGTTDVLDELRQTVSLEWRLYTDSFRQDVLLTALAREAFVRGADWVLPLDADEFWYAPKGSLAQVLKRTDAGALRVQLVNFVQRRDQLTAAPAGLLTMNRRPPEPVGPIDRLEELVNSRRIGFVEILYPAKWIARTCPLLEVGWGNHTLYGSLAPAVDTDAIVCLHAPLRSRVTLENKVDSGRRPEDVREYLREAWHVRRWKRVDALGQLDAEWKANSYDGDGSLDVYGTRRSLVIDSRLTDLVAPWVGPASPEAKATVTPQLTVGETVKEEKGREAFPAFHRFAPQARVWGVMVTAGDDDVVCVNARHHLSLGIEKLLIAAIGTTPSLGELATDSRIEVSKWCGKPSRAQVLTALARQAFFRGATWVLPIDSDAFWISKEPLPHLLEQSACGALACATTTFVQNRVVQNSTVESLLTMTMRPMRVAGSHLDAATLVESGAAPFVAIATPPVYVSRATPDLRFHTDGRLSGFVGALGVSASLSRLQAPIRARSVVADVARGIASPPGLGHGAWVRRRWRRFRTAVEYDTEWTANSRVGSQLGASGTLALVSDPRLHDLVRPLISMRASDPAPRRDASNQETAGTASRSHSKLDGVAKAEILARAAKVRGWLSDDEADLLIKATERAVAGFGNEHAVVEIGSYCGRSTLVIAGVLASLDARNVVHAIDPHEGMLGGVDSSIGMGLGAPSAAEFVSNLTAANLTTYVTPLMQHSFEVEWTRGISLLFVDGLHDFESVRLDGELFTRWVVQGGLVAFHDYSELFPGVVRYVDELEASHAFRRVARASSLVLLERAAPTREDLLRDSRGRGRKSGPERPQAKQPLRAPASEADDEVLRSVANTNLEASLARSVIRSATLTARLSTAMRQLALVHPEPGRQSMIVTALDEAVREARGLLVKASRDLADARVLEADLRANVNRLTERLVTLEASLTESAGQRRAMASALTANERRVAELLASASWRVTAPLRATCDVGLDIVRSLRNATRSVQSRSPGSIARDQPIFHAHPKVSPSEILIVTDAVPTPDRDAGSVRMTKILNLLRQLGHRVTLASDLAEPRAEHAARLEKQSIRVIYGESATIDHLMQEGRRYATVVISRPDVALKYLFAVRANAVNAQVIYDSVDLHWVRLGRALEFEEGTDLTKRVEYYRQVEWLAITASDLVLTVTEEERATLLAIEPALRVAVLPTIHSVEPLTNPWENRSGLLFIGGFSHRPNIDAVRHFVRDVLPLVHHSLPEAVFTILGSDMPPEICELATSAIRPVGHVADVRQYFSAARMLIAPLRYGAGMKGKIGHAMSHGLPVVTTSVGAEGLGLIDAETALIADGASAFADAVVRLYTDRSLWERIAGNSVTHIEARLSERVVLAQLESVFGRPTVPPSLARP